MALSMPVVVDERCRLHDPGGEIWVGVRTPAAEVPARLGAVLRVLAAAGAEIVDATAHAEDALRSVHDSGLLKYLASAWSEWQAAGLPEEPGQDRVVPLCLILRGETPDAVRIPSGCRFHPRCPMAIDDCKRIDPDLRVPAAAREGSHRAACIRV